MKTIYQNITTRGTVLMPANLFRTGTLGLCLLGLLLAPVRLAMAQNPPAEELRTIAQVRSLTPQQAAQHLPVQLKGVVTFYNVDLFSHFIQDETGGIYLVNTNLPALTVGQVVEVAGVTDPGEYAPVILPSSVKVVGEGNLPAAKPVSVDELVSGHQDSQFIEVEGIIRSVSYDELTKQNLVDIVAGGERFTAYAGELPMAQPEALLDSTVKVSGICSTLFNLQRQLFGFRLLVPRAADLVIVKPAPGNPFDIPTQGLSSLLQFTPQGSLGHRVKLSGIVTYFEAGKALFIQDELGGVQCLTGQSTPLAVGDRVEVIGFPAKGEYTPILQDSTYRKVGTGTAPAPVLLEPEDVLLGKHDCQLIQISARLMERPGRGRDQFMALEKNGYIFHAFLSPDSSREGYDRLQKGSEVLVTGICLIQRGNSWQAGEGWRAKSFRLLLRSTGDVVVESTPPFWTQWDIVRTVGFLVIIILIAALWISMLHRRIAAHQAAKT